MVQGGRSNLTYIVSDGTARWVVRRPPLGHLLATAHDVVREWRIVAALGDTPVPVPAALAVCSGFPGRGVNGCFGHRLTR